MDKIVDFSSEKIVKVHSNELSQFKKYAIKNEKNKKYRKCLHESPESPLHEMIICRHIDDYSLPDKHKGISESHTIIDGTEAVVLFDDNGGISEIFLLDKEKGYISYRINEEIYHMIVPLTETSIDYEVKPGPFGIGSNIFPEWAPEKDDEVSVKEFMKRIRDQIEQYIEDNSREVEK